MMLVGGAYTNTYAHRRVSVGIVGAGYVVHVTPSTQHV
jgi:hypothetical protein